MLIVPHAAEETIAEHGPDVATGAERTVDVSRHPRSTSQCHWHNKEARGFCLGRPPIAGGEVS